MTPRGTGEYILESLNDLPDGCPAGVFIRHAARYDITDFAAVHLVQLTPEGEQDAFALGRRLPLARTLHVYHSFMDRCRMTGTRIAEGFRAAGGRAEIRGALDELCGAYVRDFDAFLELVQVAQAQEEGYDFIRHWFDGAHPETLVTSRDVTAAIQRQAILRHLRAHDPDALVLFVSHDWDILAFRESHLNIRHEDVGWVEFLDGVALAYDGDALQVAWRHYRHTLPDARENSFPIV